MPYRHIKPGHGPVTAGQLLAGLAPRPQLHPGRLHGVRHLTQPPSPAAHSAGDARTLPMSERARCGVAWHRPMPVPLRWRQEVSP
jgi:hypothetical protein